MRTSIVLLLISTLPMQACASTQDASESRTIATASPAQVQFFVGKIQRGSLDRKTKYGPSFESVVRRTIDPKEGKILECVFQEGKVFITEMDRTNNPLVYNVNDLGGFSTGTLVMETEAAQAWSYDIDVLKPMTGKITGSLSERNGARILPDGRMEITKIWNNQMLISESYSAVSENEYLTRLPSITPGPQADIVAKMCK